MKLKASSGFCVLFWRVNGGMGYKVVLFSGIELGLFFNFLYYMF